MGWLSACLGSGRGKPGARKLCVHGGRRVSNDAHFLRSPGWHVDSGNTTPRIEDYLQPTIVKYDSYLRGITPEPRTPLKGTRDVLSFGKDAEWVSNRDLATQAIRLKQDLAVRRRAAGSTDRSRLREEARYLRSPKVDTLENQGKSLYREKFIPVAENVRGTWNPHRGYVSEAMPLTNREQGEERQVVQHVRKTFSELLIETNFDETSSMVKGPLAIAATAAAAERAARKLSGVPLIRSQDRSSTLSEPSALRWRNGSSPGTLNPRMCTLQYEGSQMLAESRGSFVNLLPQRKEGALQQQKLLDVSKPTAEGETWLSGVLSSEQGKLDAEYLKRSYRSKVDSDADLDRKWIEGRNEATMSSSSTIHSSPPADIFLNGTSEALAGDLLIGGKGLKKVCPRSLQSPHSIPLLVAADYCSGSDYNEPHASSAVAAFREGRVQSKLSEKAMHMSLGSRSLGNFFWSSRKRAMPARPFRRPLSPVPETLSLDEGLLSRHGSKSEVADCKQQLSSNLRLDSGNGSERPEEHGSPHGVSRDTCRSDIMERCSNAPGPAVIATDSSSDVQSFSFRTAESMSSNNEGNTEKISSRSYLAMPRPGNRRQSLPTDWSQDTKNYTVSEGKSEVHVSEDQWHNAWRTGTHLASEYGDAADLQDGEPHLCVEEVQEETNLRCQSSIDGEAKPSWGSFSKFAFGLRFESSEEQDSSSIPEQHQLTNLEDEERECEDQTCYRDSGQKVGGSKEFMTTSLVQPEQSSMQSGASEHKFCKSRDKCESGNVKVEQIGIWTDRGASNRADCIIGEAVDVPSRSSYGTNATERDYATMSPKWKSSSLEVDDKSILGQVSSDEANSHEMNQEGFDTTLMHTPRRQPQVAPEVFISPKGARKELAFTRLLDIKIDDRPIFGTIADHWEATWASKRQTWDGKGIPNSTNKYKEDQKVNWHATPFEERLVRALATHGEVSPRKLFNVTTHLASRNDRGLEAH